MVSVNEKYLEELDCLQAIRAIENNVEKAMHETATDMIKGIEAFQTLNEMDKKYDVIN